jgi:iron complex transport system ATP-binding protein
VSLLARDMSLTLGGRRVLDGVNLAIERGRLLAILGPNGAGKSTLLRILAGVQATDHGEITLDGSVLGLPRPPVIARRIGYLAQDARSVWPLSVHDVVALGRLPWRRAWSPLAEHDHQAVLRAMRATDVETLAQRPISQLSGGERARVMLARVLAGEPDMILADEPVAGLDPAHQIDVMQLLVRLASQGAAVVVVLHDLTLAARYADRVALLLEGQLHADGTPNEVLVEATLRSCFGIRVHRGETADGPFVVPVGTVSRKTSVS